MSATHPVVVPAGVAEDYFLTNTRVIAASADAGDYGDRTFQVGQVAQERLRALTGKRVGVTGHVSGKPDLLQLQVVSIREISGGCPALPTPPQS
jgi:hypothetical protein